MVIRRYSSLKANRPSRRRDACLAQHWATLDVVLTYDFPHL